MKETGSDTGACLIHLPDARSPAPEIRTAWIDGHPSDRRLPAGPARGNEPHFQRWACETGRRLAGTVPGVRRIGDLAHGSSEPTREPPALASRSRSALIAPLLEGRRPFGVLRLESRRADHFTAAAAAGLESAAEALVRTFPRVVFQERQAEEGTDTGFIGISPAFLRLEVQLQQAARCNVPVLLLGERGSGKEVAARAIHLWSGRHRKPFLPVLLSALPESLAADELFGHEKHAFTGATRQRQGKFEAAGQGTLFLDEVADIDPQLQAALLRVIEQQEFSRLGRDLPVRVDSRIIAATNRDLQAACRRGDFRRDLYDRLAVFEIQVPPLRERREDIALLTDHFLRRYCTELHRARDLGHTGHCKRCSHPGKVACATPAFFETLQSHHWPGNVRELKNLLLRLVATAREETFDVHHLPADWRLGGATPGEDREFGSWNLEHAIRTHIESVLEMTEHNKSQAARLLEIPYTTLQSKIKRLGIRSSKQRASGADAPPHA